MRLLQANGIEPQTDQITVAVTQYKSPVLFAVIVAPELREPLSKTLVKLTGRLWATHWEVWILTEAEAQMLLAHDAR